MPNPLLDAIPAVTMLALAPKSVPFPPGKAPHDNAYAIIFRGSVSGNCLAKMAMTGIMVAVYEMLSKNADVMALTHIIRVMATPSWSSCGWPEIYVARNSQM
jgi:hypothetical protein